MEESKKVKKLLTILKKRYPFIKDMVIEDDSYTATLFIDAKIDAFEMCETFGFTPRHERINMSESGTFMGFVYPREQDTAYNTSKKINGELDEINKLLPEQFRTVKSPHIHRFFGIDNSLFNRSKNFS